MATDSGWTTFALAYEIDKCWTFGNDFAEQKKNTIVNTFWKDVITLIIDLRKELRPLTDLDFLCWPLWYDPIIRLPIIKILQRNNVCMVSDLLEIDWEIMSKEIIERTKGVTLTFLEYMSINHSIKRFISNAEKIE